MFVAASVYDLPFVDGLLDSIVMVRVMHHLQEPSLALSELARILKTDGTFIVEYANKRNLKAMLRYWMGQQDWSPFEYQPYEFVRLNYDFHPTWMSQQLQDAGFAIEKELAVSHFRLPLLKRLVPARYLAAADGAVQVVGAAWKLTPSIFVRCRVPGQPPDTLPEAPFVCPNCRGHLEGVGDRLCCTRCAARWPVRDGLYDFKEPI